MNCDNLSINLKEYAYDLGADLVGIANIERYSNAPIMMSPQGILPKAKSVVVCAIHHPDACIELGGEISPHHQGPYVVQGVMNDKLDLISFKIARFLEAKGYQTVPIAASNIWRYMQYKELDAIFAPDISNIYSSVAAGLSEMGWHGIALTPEYGPRNRFVSIITEAPLKPDPLYNGPKLCDMCGECIRACPTDAYRKEVNGVKTIVIEGREYSFANKNLWRCSWAEHFGLDLDMEIPEKVDEDVIMQYYEKYGMRGGAMGVCIKCCLPAHLRIKDSTYTKYYRRKRHYIPSDLPVHRSLIDKINTIAYNYYIDSVSYINKETLDKKDINIKQYLPDGNSVVLLAIEFNKPEMSDYDFSDKEEAIQNDKVRSARFLANFASLDIARELEKVGYTALGHTGIDNLKLAEISGIKPCQNKVQILAHVITSAKLNDSIYKNSSTDCSPRNAEELTSFIKKYGTEVGADMVGITSAQTISHISEQLAQIKDNEEIFLAKNKNYLFQPFDADVEKKKRKILNASNYMDDAKTVIVIGMHFPDAPVHRAGKPPAEPVGPYIFSQYEVERLLGQTGLSVVKKLEQMGYKAMYTFDLMNMGSHIASPRGYLYNSFCNTFEALAAGLGEMTYNGNLYTKQYGINQRFVAIITNAELVPDEINITGKVEKYCSECGICKNSCPAKAFMAENEIKINVNDTTFTYIPIDTKKCDWAGKYALINEDGFKYQGSKVNISVPEKIDEDNLKEALLQLDPMQKHLTITAEVCIINCPYAEKLERVL